MSLNITCFRNEFEVSKYIAVSYICSIFITTRILSLQVTFGICLFSSFITFLPFHAKIIIASAFRPDEVRCSVGGKRQLIFASKSRSHGLVTHVLHA